MGFIWQTSKLFADFMNGNTVTNISVGVLHNQTLPAITVCPVGLDFKLISKINPELRELYDEYLHLIRGLNKSSIESLKDQINDKYLRAQKIFFDQIGDKPIGDTIVNYTKHIDEKMINVKFYKAISSGDIHNDLSPINESSKLGFEMISVPMETIAIFEPLGGNIFSLTKCLTLFSHCESGWSDITMDFKYMLIKISLDIESYPFYPYDPYPIAVHSPNNIPELSMDFKFFKFGSMYNIDYSQWKIERLGNGYDTNCRHYDPKTLTRSECIFNCYQKTMRNVHNIDSFIRVFYITRKDYFESNGNLTLFNSTDKIEYEVLLKCEDKCHKECQFRYYSFNLDKYYDEKMDGMNVEINVKHNAMPDLFIRHIPETPFITFICNLGGLLGMWLGTSFLTILRDVLTLIVKCTKHICKLSPDQRKYFTFNFYFNSDDINSIRPR